MFHTKFKTSRTNTTSLGPGSIGSGFTLPISRRGIRVFVQTLTVATLAFLVATSVRGDVIQFSNVNVTGGNVGFTGIIDAATAANTDFDINQTEGVFLVQQTGANERPLVTQSFTSVRVADGSNRVFNPGEQIFASGGFHFDPTEVGIQSDIQLTFDVDLSGTPAVGELFFIGPRTDLLLSDNLSNAIGHWQGGARGFEASDSFSVEDLGNRQFRFTVDSQTVGSGSDDFRFIVADFEPNVVPEPGSMAIVALGLLGIATRRRRK